MSSDDYADIARLIRRSLVFRLLDSFVRVVATSARRSRCVALARARVVAAAELPREQRVRIVALFLVTAAAAELILAGLIPERSAPAMPRALWLLAVVVACVPAAVPRPVLVAWDHWTLARR